jgi:hypothetical protein
MTRFGACACTGAQATRVHRSAWMRLLFPSRALFRCGSCGREFLVTPAQQANLGSRAQAERAERIATGDTSPADPGPST